MAKKDKTRTVFGPKYSLIISVMIKTKGHNIAPAVKLKPNPDTPNIFQSKGAIPNNFSKEKIFPPTNSATSVFPIKKPDNIKIKKTLLSPRILWIAIELNDFRTENGYQYAHSINYKYIYCLIMFIIHNWV